MVRRISKFNRPSRISSRFARRNYRAFGNTLTDILPSGSGIDYDWDFEVLDDNTVLATNGWHYMSQTGMYLGGAPFTVELKTDGSFNGPVFDTAAIANSELGKEITNDILADDSEIGEITKEDIISVIDSEFDDIADYIYQTLDSVDKKQLGQAVRQYISENI